MKYLNFEALMAEIEDHDDNDLATVKFPVEVGLLLRRRFRDGFKFTMVYVDHLDYEILESKGLLESSFLITITDIPVGKLRQVLRWLQDLNKGLNQ